MRTKNELLFTATTADLTVSPESMLGCFQLTCLLIVHSVPRRWSFLEVFCRLLRLTNVSNLRANPRKRFQRFPEAIRNTCSTVWGTRGPTRKR